MTDKKDVGRFYHSAATGSYWSGGCSCGSGKEGRELRDGRGFFCCIVCDDCEASRRAKFRPEALTDPSYETEEPIEEDE